MQRTELRIS